MKKLIILICLIPIIWFFSMLFISSQTYLHLFNNQNIVNMLNSKNEIAKINVLYLLISITHSEDKSYTPSLIKALRSNVEDSLYLSKGPVNSGEIANEALNHLYNENKFYYDGYNAHMFQIYWKNKTFEEIKNMSDEEIKKEAQEETEKTIVFWENAYKMAC